MPFHKEMKLKGGFILCSPVCICIQEMTQLIRPNGKHGNWCADTTKHFPGIMTVVMLCFATKHATCSARPQATHASYHDADEIV